MSKIKVNEDEYIRLCNKELQNHPKFQGGMKINGVPPNTNGSDLTGYSWKGPSAEMPALVSSVIDKIEDKYELEVSLRN